MAEPAVHGEATEPEVTATTVESSVEVAGPAADKASVEDDEDESAKADRTTEPTNAEGVAEVGQNGNAAEAKEEKNGNAAEAKEEKTRIDDENNHNNSKYDASVLPVTDDPHLIRIQVEFYFGDSNLPQDKHLWTLTGGFENKPVGLKKICAFGRMHRFQPYEAVVKALRDSHFLVISGEDGEEMVSRKVAYKSSKLGDKMPVSIYAKGFGDEKPSTQFDIEAFFAKLGPVNAIRLRRTADHLFKGSVFAEFDNEEQAKAFLALDPPPKWEGHDLLIMSKKAYVEGKSKLIKEGKLQPSTDRTPKTFWEGQVLSGRGRGRGGNHFKGDKDDWKARRDHERRRGHGGGRGARGGRGGRGGRARGRGGYVRGGRSHDGGDSDGASKEKCEGENDGTDKKPVSANSKHAREDDGVVVEPPAKRVDNKTETAAEAEAAA